MPFEGLCSVYMAGPSCDDPNVPVISIQLVNAEGGAFDNMWFVAPSGKEREFLAVAIAAINGKQKVWAGIRDVTPWTPLTGLYLVNQPSE